jgi:hypothetical protein
MFPHGSSILKNQQVTFTNEVVSHFYFPKIGFMALCELHIVLMYQYILDNLK